MVVAGPALTLQFMPKREDLYGVDEYNDPEQQLHRHVLYHTQPGDIVVVDARGNMASGVFGEGASQDGGEFLATSGGVTLGCSARYSGQPQIWVAP